MKEYIRYEFKDFYRHEEINENDEYVKRNGGYCVSTYRLNEFANYSAEKPFYIAHVRNGIVLSSVSYDENGNITEEYERKGA